MGRWRVEKSFSFEAAHYLPFHEGKCKRLHGHSWRGILICEGPSLQEEGSSTGMLVDFGDMGEVIKPILELYLDHHFLNHTTLLDSPTSEEIARWVYDKVKKDLPLLTGVVIDETCTSRAYYTGD